MRGERIEHLNAGFAAFCASIAEDPVARKRRTLDQLLLDATAGLLPEAEMAASLEPGVHGDDVRPDERAIEPVRTQLPDEQFQRLVSALAVVLGWEAMIVVHDICGLDQKRGRAVLAWIPEVILDAVTMEKDAAAT